jgi:hypothetical protein
MKKNKKQYDFNGGWSAGEATLQIGMKNTERVHRSKKSYSRKVKYKLLIYEKV